MPAPPPKPPAGRGQAWSPAGTGIVIQAKLNEAVALHQHGRFMEAQAHYQEILRLQPNHFDAQQLLATIALQTGQPAKAVELFEKALRINPRHPGSLNNMGAALLALGRPVEALAAFDRAIAAQANYAEAHNNRGNALNQLNRTKDALGSFERSLALKPDYPDALNNRGAVLSALGRPAEALESFSQAVRRQPRHLDALTNTGDTLRDLKRYADAILAYDSALALQPNHLKALNNKAAALLDLERPADALAIVDQVLRIEPAMADAFNNRAGALLLQKRFEEALAASEQALTIQPGHANALFNRAAALFRLDRFEEALASYDAAIAARPAYPEAFVGRGETLRKLGRRAEALPNFDQALACGADYAEAYYGRGNVQFELGRTEEAVRSFDQALRIKPDHAEALNNRGAALTVLKRYQDAIADFDAAVRFRPGYAEALSNSGSVLLEVGRFEEAIAHIGEALAIEPNYTFLAGRLWQSRLRICDWTNYAEERDRLLRETSEGRRVIPPFPALMLADPVVQRAAAESWVALKHKVACDAWARTPDAGPSRKPGRIRVGYFSADFRNHAVMALMAGMFERHDKTRFETFAFSLGAETNDEMQQRAVAAFDHFLNVRLMPDEAIARLARERDLDIAIDLTGFTNDGRIEIFAHRAAPVQVNFLGFTGTMGVAWYNYLVADEICIPEDQRRNYAEKIVWLPDSYQPNDSKRPVPAPSFTRAQCGLPEDAFVFCCFNNSYKITPDVFDIWARILERTPGSVLWLFADNDSAQNNLAKEAEARGLASRVIFARRTPRLDDHLGRYRLADLFLDTTPYNAHTTTSDALWAGLPVLTRIGSTFAGRVAASLLTSVELPELITETPQAYEDLAVALAGDPDRIKALKDHLAATRETTPLFDTVRFTRHFEAALVRMHERRIDGLPPDHIAIEQGAV